MNSLESVHASPFSHKERRQLISRLALEEPCFDICVIGGGITGAGVARDAAQRGLSVLLLEKSDFAEGTSSRSSKLIHGGVRYLEHFEFGLVAESTRERALLWKLAPKLAHPIAFLFPAYSYSRVPLWKLNIGLWLYDLLALFRTPGMHGRYSAQKTAKLEPALNNKELSGSIFYWDGATDDALLTLSTAVDAQMLGATLLSRCELKEIAWNEDNPTKPHKGHNLKVYDHVDKRTFQARARVVVSATGPWTDLFPSRERFTKKKILAATRGSHIVVSRESIPIDHAIVLIHPKDERVLFAIPWGSHSIIGTTDIFDDKAPEHVAITRDEVDYLIDAAKHFFPEHPLSTDDIVSTWSGLRPLVAPPEGSDEGSISREHHIEWQELGFLVVAGGKLTTYREMAKEVVDKVIEETQRWPVALSQKAAPCRTQRRPLPSFAYPKNHQDLRAENIDAEDVAGICRTQMVLSLEDLLVRRTHIFYKEKDNGLAFIERHKELLIKELSWSEAEWNEQVQAYERYLDINVRQPLNR